MGTGSKQRKEEEIKGLRSMIGWDGHVAVENESIDFKEYNKKSYLK